MKNIFRRRIFSNELQIKLFIRFRVSCLLWIWLNQDGLQSWKIPRGSFSKSERGLYVLQHIIMLQKPSQNSTCPIFWMEVKLKLLIVRFVLEQFLDFYNTKIAFGSSSFCLISLIALTDRPTRVVCSYVWDWSYKDAMVCVFLAVAFSSVTYIKVIKEPNNSSHQTFSLYIDKILTGHFKTPPPPPPPPPLYFWCLFRPLLPAACRKHFSSSVFKVSSTMCWVWRASGLSSTGFNRLQIMFCESDIHLWYYNLTESVQRIRVWEYWNENIVCLCHLKTSEIYMYTEICLLLFRTGCICCRLWCVQNCEPTYYLWFCLIHIALSIIM